MWRPRALTIHGAQYGLGVWWKPCFISHRNILIPLQTISRTVGSQCCCFIRPSDPNMPGTWQYQQSVRIPLNRIASDIRVKIFNQTPVLSTMKLSDTLPVLNCNMTALGPLVWASYKTGPRKQSRPFYRQMIRIQPTSMSLNSLTRGRSILKYLVFRIKIKVRTLAVSPRQQFR